MNINVGKCIKIYLENTTKGHNKWYRMTRKDADADTWKAEWGPLDTSGVSQKTYDEYVKSWYDMYREKEKKGYVIKSHMLQPPPPKPAPYEVPERLKGILKKLKALRDMIDDATFTEDWDSVDNVINDIEDGTTDQIEEYDLDAFNDLYRKHKKLQQGA